MSNVRGEQHGRAKLTEQEVRFIIQSKGITQANLASWYGISQSTIHRIRNGIRWKYLNIGANPDSEL